MDSQLTPVLADPANKNCLARPFVGLNSEVFDLPELFVALLKGAIDFEEESNLTDESPIQFGSDTDDESEEEDSDESDDDSDADEDSEDTTIDITIVEEKLPVFEDKGPVYASWADEMDEVDPIVPDYNSTPVFSSWADEMDKVDPILPKYDMPVYSSWADEMDKVDPILPNYEPPAQTTTTTTTTTKSKKSVRFAEWKNEVFEVPADEEARKIDLRYLYPQNREDDDEDEDESEEEQASDEEENDDDHGSQADYGDVDDEDYESYAESYKQGHQRRNSI